MRCDKKRAAVLPRCIFVAESALSKFIRIFRDYDAHRINALIDCRNSSVESRIATDWHKLHITSARSRTTIGHGGAGDARERPACARAEIFALIICKAWAKGNGTGKIAIDTCP
jgi:hypothetical protein